jgi:ribosomal subunit interface protein
MDLHITFRDDTSSEALHAYVEKKAAKLDHSKGRPQRCRVVMESPHRHHRHGRHYRVRIDLTVPGFELIAGSVRKDDNLHEDAYAAVDDAFDDAQRLLNDHYERMIDRARHPGILRGLRT